MRTSRESGNSSAIGGSGSSSPAASYGGTGSAATTGSGTASSETSGIGSSVGSTGAGATRIPSSAANRTGTGQAARRYPQQQMVSGGGSTPFAMVRRMMDDMDRLFSEFGFVHPGQLASLLGGDLWPSAHTQRSLSGGASGGAGLGSGQSRGQQGLQRGGHPGGLQPLQGIWAPQVELFERGSNLVVRADLPGLTREDVDVEVDDDMLIIRGERRNEVDDDQEGFYRSERSYGSFYRAVPLPDNVDPSSCHATFKNGVLEVTLPKPQSTLTKAKRIEVR